MTNSELLSQLTNREVEILQLLAEGWCNKQIADQLLLLRKVGISTKENQVQISDFYS